VLACQDILNAKFQSISVKFTFKLSDIILAPEDEGFEPEDNKFHNI